MTSTTLCSLCIDAVLWKEKNHHPYSDVTSLKEYVGLTGTKKNAITEEKDGVKENQGSGVSGEAQETAGKAQETAGEAQKTGKAQNRTASVPASKNKQKSKKRNVRKGGDETTWSQIQVSHECFVVILIAEVTFRKCRLLTTRLSHTDVLQYLTDGLMYAWNGSAVPDCHDIKRKILQFYVRARRKQFGTQRSAELKEQAKLDRSSKSEAMRQVVRRV